jgi:hypothetical protein
MESKIASETDGNAANQEHVDKLFAAELQFRLAAAVRVAVTFKSQPLDLPTEWVHGQHRVVFEEIALRQDQAEFAAHFLFQSATHLMAVAILNAIRAAVANPKRSPDVRIRESYQVARMIRNAFAHNPLSPTWSIDDDCRDKVFLVPDIISLDTTGIDGTEFDWRQYGGPLALFRLCRFVRFEILKDEVKPRKNLPVSNKIIQQQGDLMLLKVSELPSGAKPVKMDVLDDGGIALGGGHILYPNDKD